MVRLFATAVIVAMATASTTAKAADDWWHEEWATYRGFLIEPACGESRDIDGCIRKLDLWKRDFKWATIPFWKGTLIGRRNLAVCFATGCDGAVKPNPLLACAWITLAIKSGDPKIDALDISGKENLCGKLDPGEQSAAEAQAKRLLTLLGE